MPSTREKSVYISREVLEDLSKDFEPMGSSSVSWEIETTGRENDSGKLGENGIADYCAELYSQGYRNFYAQPNPWHPNPSILNKTDGKFSCQRYPLFREQVEKLELEIRKKIKNKKFKFRTKIRF